MRNCRLKYFWVWVLALLVHCGGEAKSQEQVLSDEAEAYLLTCGAGNDFYTSFGHSAIRIADSASGIDEVYNYGTFNFATPHFYWKFMRGQLDYCLARESWQEFEEEYRYEDRAVFEQRMNLSPQEVCNLYVLLETNYQPQYRYYRYDFLRDNCATRVRDVILAACGRSQPDLPDASGETYRRFLHRAMRDTLEWWRLGVDLLLGLPADHRCSSSEAMFFPPEMQRLFSWAQRDGDPLLQPAVLRAPKEGDPLNPSFPPLVATSLLFVAVALLSWRYRQCPVLDRILFFLAGIAGLFLLFMWLGTSHWCTRWNLNILWLSPMLLLIGIRLERSPRWALWLQEGCFLAAAVWVVACGLSPAILPLILALALRTALLWRKEPRVKCDQKKVKSKR